MGVSISPIVARVTAKVSVDDGAREDHPARRARTLAPLPTSPTYPDGIALEFERLRAIPRPRTKPPQSLTRDRDPRRARIQRRGAGRRQRRAEECVLRQIDEEHRVRARRRERQRVKKP